MHWSKVILFFSFFKSPIPKKGILINYLFFLALDNNRFAETEAIAVLSILVSQFKVTIKEEPQFATETFEQRKTRILSARAGLTITWVLSSG